MEYLEVNNFYEVLIFCIILGFGLYLMCEIVAALIHFFKDIVTLSIKD